MQPQHQKTSIPTWRTHSCVPRRHSCRRPAPRKRGVEKSLDTARTSGTHDCVSHGPYPANLLPAYRLALVLLIQPLLQRSEIVEARGSVQTALTGHLVQSLLPGAAEPHFEHPVQLLAGLLAAINRATRQWRAASDRSTISSSARRLL